MDGLSLIIQRQLRKLPESMREKAQLLGAAFVDMSPYRFSTIDYHDGRLILRNRDPLSGYDPLFTYGDSPEDKRRQLETALVMFNAAVRKNKMNPDYPYYAGLCRENLADITEKDYRIFELQEALSLYKDSHERALRINPNKGYPNYEIALGRAYFKLGELLSDPENIKDLSEFREELVKQRARLRQLREEFPEMAKHYLSGDSEDLSGGFIKENSPQVYFQKSYNHLDHAIKLMEIKKVRIDSEAIRMRDEAFKRI